MIDEAMWCWTGFVVFVLCFTFGVASRLWSAPAKRPPIKIGDLVHCHVFPRIVFRVVAECEQPHRHGSSRALFVERAAVAFMGGAVGTDLTPARLWVKERDLTPHYGAKP